MNEPRRYELTPDQRLFAQQILVAFLKEAPSLRVMVDVNGRITDPEALDNFHESILDCVQAYDFARSEEIGRLKGEVTRCLNVGLRPPRHVVLSR